MWSQIASNVWLKQIISAKSPPPPHTHSALLFIRLNRMQNTDQNECISSRKHHNTHPGGGKAPIKKNKNEISAHDCQQLSCNLTSLDYEGRRHRRRRQWSFPINTRGNYGGPICFSHHPLIVALSPPFDCGFLITLWLYAEFPKKNSPRRKQIVCVLCVCCVCVVWCRVSRFVGRSISIFSREGGGSIRSRISSRARLHMRSQQQVRDPTENSARTTPPPPPLWVLVLWVGGFNVEKNTHNTIVRVTNLHIFLSALSRLSVHRSAMQIPPLWSGLGVDRGAEMEKKSHERLLRDLCRSVYFAWFTPVFPGNVCPPPRNEPCFLYDRLERRNVVHCNNIAPCQWHFDLTRLTWKNLRECGKKKMRLMISAALSRYVGVTFWIHSGITPVGQFSQDCAKINQSSVYFHYKHAVDWLIDDYYCLESVTVSKRSIMYSKVTRKRLMHILSTFFPTVTRCIEFIFRVLDKAVM